MTGSWELTVYCDCEPVLDMEYQKDSDAPSPSVAIINAVGEAAGVDPLELPSLYEHVDTDALNDLFGSHDGAEDAGAILSFNIDTWNVFIRADGRIRVCDATRPIDPEPVFESATV